MTTLEKLRAESPFVKGRASALKTRERKRQAMQAAIKKRDWRRLKQVPNAQRRQPDVRAKVDEIVSVHLAARKKLGTPAEDMGRVYIEAIEIAKIEVRQKDTVTEWGAVEPRRKYDVYVTQREP